MDKKGFKQTELGLIPEDWEVKNLEEIGTFSKGNGISRTESNSGNIPCVRYGEIYTTHNDYIKKFYSFISEIIAKHAKKLQKGDLLFAGSGETKEDIGKCVAYVDNIIAYAGGDIIVLSPQKKYDSKFLGFILNAPYVAKQKASRGQGDAIVHITSTALSDVTIYLPSTFVEQTAIATALSNVDALISALDKKITKKKQIKQGAMQQLLTGKKRLPGFSGEWEEKKLGSFTHIKTGSRNGDEQCENGKYPFYVRSQVVQRIDSYSFDGEAILIPGEGGIGNIFHYIIGKFDYHQRVYKISNFDVKVNGKYIYYYLIQYFGKYAMSLTVKATVDSLRLPTFQEFIIVIPPTLAEQTAIAQILSDMDNEIEALGAKREKYIGVKQGMMQNLLSGQIRLV